MDLRTQKPAHRRTYMLAVLQSYLFFIVIFYKSDPSHRPSFVGTTFTDWQQKINKNVNENFYCRQHGGGGGGGGEL